VRNGAEHGDMVVPEGLLAEHGLYGVEVHLVSGRIDVNQRRALRFGI
jgi:hypothetical protein